MHTLNKLISRVINKPNYVNTKTALVQSALKSTQPKKIKKVKR